MKEVRLGDITVYHGDNRIVLPTLAEGSVDALVCDPPAGIAFLNLEFDTFRRKKKKIDLFPSLGRGPTKDGKHPKGFAKDVHWEYGKDSRDAFIDFIEIVAKECLRVVKPGGYGLVWAIPRTSHWTAMGLENAGWLITDCITHLFLSGYPKSKGCLKPSCEFWWLIRKKGKKVLPLGIKDCKIGPGRWPPNLIVSHSPDCTDTLCGENCPVRLLDQQGGKKKSGKPRVGSRPATKDLKGLNYSGGFKGQENVLMGYGDEGGISRMFYTPKASKQDRSKGNPHPTVKSIDLMKWLVKLVSPLGGMVLDPFLGSGSTALACQRTGRKCIGIEKKESYFNAALRRLQTRGQTAETELVKKENAKGLLKYLEGN